MKACIMTSAHRPFDIRIFHRECKSLMKDGYSVTLLVQHDTNETVDGIQIVAMPKVQSRFLRLFYLTLRIFAVALKEKADVYHFHDLELVPIGVLLKLFTNRKIIYDVHEDYGKQMLSKYSLPIIVRRSIALLIRKVEYLSSQFFDGIITATDDISINFNYHDRVISVTNFPVISNFLVSSNYDDNDGEEFNLIYIGGLSKVRGLSELVKALELINPCKKVKLTLCGEFDSNEFELEVTSLSGFQKTEFIGWLDHSAVRNLLMKSDAGIICFLPEPNHMNSMPNKLFEYMAAGIPVIASDFPLWQEIVLNSNCGLCVNPAKPQDIANAIQFLMEHRELGKEMGKNGRKAAFEKYNWENESKKLLELYDSVLKS